MSKEKTAKKKRRIKRGVKLLIVGAAMLLVLAIFAPLGFMFAVSSEWDTRTEIKAAGRALDVESEATLNQLTEIARSNRILDILAVDKNGNVIYSVKNASIFSAADAVVKYDNITGLIKFDGGRISYFQRGSTFGSLLNIGDDDDFDDDDDDFIYPFDRKFVEDNIYQTIMLNDNKGNTVYIVCTQDIHREFITFIVLMSVGTGIFWIYAMIAGGYTIYKHLVPSCSECGEKTRKGNVHCTKCGASLLPRTCNSCGAQARAGDIICGKCGKNIDEISSAPSTTTETKEEG